MSRDRSARHAYWKKKKKKNQCCFKMLSLEANLFTLCCCHRKLSAKPLMVFEGGGQWKKWVSFRCQMTSLQQTWNFGAAEYELNSFAGSDGTQRDADILFYFLPASLHPDQESDLGLCLGSESDLDPTRSDSGLMNKAFLFFLHYDFAFTLMRRRIQFTLEKTNQHLWD